MRRVSIIVTLTCSIMLLVSGSFAQTFDRLQRDRGMQMLRDVVDGLRKHYFDTNFRNVDFAAKAKIAENTIQNATSNSQVFGAIAGFLDNFNDSHTFFNPPSRSARREFGYTMQLIGEDCYITQVRPRTDPSEKVAPGDRVVAFQGYVPNRANLWKLNYAYNRLFAVTTHQMKIARPDGTEQNVEIAARTRQDKRVLDLTTGSDMWDLVREEENAEHISRQRLAEFGDELLIWKMPEFEMTQDEVDGELKLARRHQALVLDLRGNPGGLVKTLEFMVSGVMDHDVTIATRKGRKADLKPMVAKKRTSPFTGRLIVLIDSRSASAAELFARVVQLEHRGVVLGDLSSGSVMESRYYPFSDGADTKIFYGASITESDLVMQDGKSLEHAGVLPDERILPTGADLASGHDPVLSRAAELAGVKLDPTAAGKLFPFEWQPN